MPYCELHFLHFLLPSFALSSVQMLSFAAFPSPVLLASVTLPATVHLLVDGKGGRGEKRGREVSTFPATSCCQLPTLLDS